MNVLLHLELVYFQDHNGCHVPNHCGTAVTGDHMARMNWDSENRQARLRRWYADNRGNSAESEPPPVGEDAWDHWARKQVTKSIQRVQQAFAEPGIALGDPESEVLKHLRDAQQHLERGHTKDARDALNQAVALVQQARTGSMQQSTREAVLAAVSLMWTLTD